jgi:putative CocE/NonD family hydrolase
MGPYSVCPKVTLRLTLPNAKNPAIHLDADVYTPEGNGPFPVLLMRQPYGRAIASTVVYAHPIWYASHGYIVVIQDVRGRGTSGGEFNLFRHEAKDGYASVLWAADLPKSNGQVGMYGFSYQGMTQLYAAATGPEPLKTIIPAMAGYDLYADKAYENGALLLQAGLGWALQLAAETARLKGDETAFQNLYTAAHNLPLNDTIPARPGILSELAPDSFFHDWLDHPQPDDYWQQLYPKLSQVNLPMLHIGGWFDPYLKGNVRLYRQMRAQSDHPQHLWIGPWGHIPWGRRVGNRDFGPAAESPIDQLQLRWFDWFLKGKPMALAEAEPVQLFTMGANQWQGFSDWPSGPVRPLYLTSSGLAGIRQTDGKLIDSPTAMPSTMDVLVHDPWRPVPSLGGHAGVPSGSFDRGNLDCRTDVLTFTTDPLVEPLPVAGTCVARFYCQADAPSFDISAILSEVLPDGRVMNLTQGHICVMPPPEESSEAPQAASPDAGDTDKPRLVEVALQPTCFTLTAGHALRLSIAAACFPAYVVNSGTGTPAGHSRLIEQRLITLHILHGPSYPSRVDLSLGQSTAPL